MKDCEQKVFLLIFIFFFFGIAILGITDHGTEKWFKKMAGWNFTPTAPPPDTGI